MLPNTILEVTEENTKHFKCVSIHMFMQIMQMSLRVSHSLHLPPIYICWADTSWLTIHLLLPLGRTYMLRRRYISWADNTTWAALRTLRLLRRSRITYTFYLGRYLYHTLVLYLYYGKPYVLFVFHQQEILCKSIGILRGGTTVGEK